MADKPKAILCPYCGNTQTESEERCKACGGYLDHLSLKVTQQHMGPWYVRDRSNPFRPGCSYEVLAKQIEKGKIGPATIMRGPTTQQYWSLARNVPGVAHLLGYCHHCGNHAEAGAKRCLNCGEPFVAPTNRDQLGLAAAQSLEDILATPKALSDPGSTDMEGSSLLSQSGSPILADLRDPENGDMDDEGGGASLSATVKGVERPAYPRDAMAWMGVLEKGEGERGESGVRNDEGGARVGMSPAVQIRVLVGISLFLSLCVTVLLIVVINAEWKQERAGNGEGSGTEYRQMEQGYSNDTGDTGDTGSAAKSGTAVSQPAMGGNESTAGSAQESWRGAYEQAIAAEEAEDYATAIRILEGITAGYGSGTVPEEVADALDRVKKEKAEMDKARQMFGG